ncbi:hypothetical protein [Corynebacterium macginleyi]|uniref:hypothetical protein n=1 Tax=Corynebacterium macginleyi TaxID=38290 RepID=UPI001909EB9B|nr:hypothetical protein [Corynebacterium macginleyi]
MTVVQETLSISRFFRTFLIRRMLSLGILRYREMRILLAFLGTTLLIVLATIGYLFYRGSDKVKHIDTLVLNLANLTLPQWVFIGFIVVRLLFLKSSNMLSLTEGLPVTDHQRSVALFINELAFIAGILTVIFFSSIAPLPFVFGIEVSSQVATSIVFPAATLVVGLAFIYNILTWGFSVIRLRRIKDILAICVLLILAGLSQIGMTTKVARITSAFQSGNRAFLWSDTYTWISEKYGFFICSLTAVVSCIFLLTAATLTSGALFTRQKEYILTRTPSKGDLSNPSTIRQTLFKSYLLSFLRAQETWITLIFALGGYILLILSQAIPPILVGEIISFLGIYAYSSTSALRNFPSLKVRPVEVYLFLCLSLLSISIPFVLVFFVGFWAIGGDSTTGLISVIGCIGTIPLTITVGIIFPSEKDNPLAVITGIAIAAISVIFFALGLSVFSLPPWGWAIATLFFLLSVASAGIFEIKKNSLPDH